MNATRRATGVPLWAKGARRRRCYRQSTPMAESENAGAQGSPVVIGDILAGKYRVDRVLGIGGMGVVVAATHLQLDQKVAIKFMLTPGLRNPALVERFAREARAAVRLKSDHVARVLDVGVLESGSPYMVMEFLDGNDLGDMIGRYGAMPVETAVDCVLQACDAVAEAHSLGIVHRDLKPRNLFWTRRNDGRALVKVLDFGISKHKSAAPDLSLTRTTEIIGSPNYMSPEQFRAARAADERSDIWALGVILYELLTGHVPFEADTITQLTAMVLSDSPRPISTLRADVPEDLARAIACCLEKDPAKRFPSVARLAEALQSFAPLDTRELAVRIARIGSGVRTAASASPPFAGSGSGGTSGNWTAGTGVSGNRRRKSAARVAVGVALGVVVIGGLAAFLHRPSSPATAVAEEKRTAGNAMAPTAVTLAPMASPPPAAPSLEPLAPMAPSAAPPPENAPQNGPQYTAPAGARVAASPQAAHAGNTVAPVPHGPRDAQAPASGAPGEEPPRYRTNW
jgi:serine/threonine protein kinase